MAGGCCGHGGAGGPRFEGASDAYRRTLWVVIGLNAAMFGVEMAAGALAGSRALKADALDFAGDAATYGLSLWAIGRPDSTRANVALLKAASLLAVGALVLGATAWRVLVLGVPEPVTMGVVGFLALAANLASVGLLWRWREGDANVRSVWLCSRNDAVGNVAVMGAAAGVALTGAAWPDLVVAAAMSGLFVSSAVGILSQALAERRAGGPVSLGHHGHAH